MKNILTCWGLAMTAGLPLSTAAQATSPETHKAAVPLSYQSVFADYKPYKEVALTDWRTLNDAVARAAGGAGGHAGQSLQGMGGSPTTGTPEKAAPAEPTDAGHSMNQQMLGGRA